MADRAGNLLIGRRLTNRAVERERVFERAADFLEEPALSRQPRLIGAGVDGAGGDQFQPACVFVTDGAGTGAGEPHGADDLAPSENRHHHTGPNAAALAPQSPGVVAGAAVDDRGVFGRFWEL